MHALILKNKKHKAYICHNIDDLVLCGEREFVTVRR